MKLIDVCPVLRKDREPRYIVQGEDERGRTWEHKVYWESYRDAQILADRINANKGEVRDDMWSLVAPPPDEIKDTIDCLTLALDDMEWSEALHHIKALKRLVKQRDRGY